MTASKKIFWDVTKCRGVRPCDWSCLKNETRTIGTEESCRFCDVRIPAAPVPCSDEFITIEADGKSRTCVAGTLLLDVLREAGIDIPTLCHHPLLPPQSACRLCVVEISLGGSTRMVAACEFPVTEPISVRTDTDRIRRNRKVLLELLLSEAPNAPRIRALAARYGDSDPPAEAQISANSASNDSPKQPMNAGKVLEGCIVCGRCIAVCEHLIGCRAMAMCGKSSNIRPSFPFNATNDENCTHCGACAAVCPTGALTVPDAPKGAPSCNLCVQICPDAAIEKAPHDGTITICDARCKECGLCVHYCPDKALRPSFYYDR